MIKLEREKALEKWQKLWDEMTQEWFKAEILQDYSAEDGVESLALWKAGDKKKSRELLKQMAKTDEWANELNKKPGVKKTRVHVIEKPLTSYLEWEIEHYKLVNLPSGEGVFLVEKDILGNIQLPDGDFCIFDNKIAVKNTYSPGGRMTHMEFYDDGNISHFLKLKEELLKNAIHI